MATTRERVPSISDAINNAIERAQKTLRNLRWFEVVRTSGHIAVGKIEHYPLLLWRQLQARAAAELRISGVAAAGGGKANSLVIRYAIRETRAGL